MDLLALSAAAGGGTVDGFDSSRLVSAGFTLLQRSGVLVRALAGRRSAILLPTTPQYLVALAASDGRGAVLVNPLATPSEIVHQFDDAGVGAVFTIASLVERIPAGLVHVLLDDSPVSALVVSADGTATRVDLGSHFGLSVEGDADAPGRDEECAIVYGSAMAGRPLGAILTHRNLIANARAANTAAENCADDHSLALLPLSHLFGLTVSALAPLMVGARVTTMARFNAINAVDLIEREGVTQVVGVPALFAGLLSAVDRRGGSLRAPALRLCICGGAPLDVALQERWFEVTGVELRQGYGLTEASPVALFNRVARPNQRGTLGFPLPGVRVSIRDPERNTPRPPGEDGEICISGDTVFRGYVHGGEQGLRVVDGWLHTGDRGVELADGTFEFLGLYKSMFTRNGFNVFPREVETVLGLMPGVDAVRAFAIPDAASGNEVGADIEGPVSEAEIKKWSEQHLAPYKRPSRIAINEAP